MAAALSDNAPRHDFSEASHRLWVRRASMIVVLSQALALLVTAALPTTTAADRSGLLLGAGVAGVAGAAWFIAVPRALFGTWRVFIASLIALAAMLAVLATTGGLLSLYFPYYLVPLLVMVMAGSREQTIMLGVTALVGLALLAAGTPDASHDSAGELGTRGIEVIAFAFAAAAASRAMGAVRAALAERTRMLADQARTDPLTGLGNRQALEDDAGRMRSAAIRRKAPFSLVAVDIDGLKAVNDNMGHAAGDDLIRRFADVLGRTTRGQDLVIRLGGDEFALLLPDTDGAGARRLIERVRAASNELSLPVAFSAGIAVLRDDESVAELLAQADAALYEEKSAHRRPGG
jgi:diguanylate cyclase (GGDEF)-like protein